MRNDVALFTQASAPRDAMRPGCGQKLTPLKRAWGMPGARCTHSLAREMVAKCARVFTAEAPEITRHSRTRMVYGLYALSPVS
jgi:hypothetical protein